jgi:hypothetical protein
MAATRVPYSFSVGQAAVQNNMVGNINPKTVANQLRPLSRLLAASGEPPHALVTATQQMYANIAAEDMGGTVVMPPIAYAFNAQAARQYKQF